MDACIAAVDDYLQPPAPEGRARQGSITLLLGPMFAGKTTALITKAKVLEDALIIKWAKDVRYNPKAVVTHDGEEVPAVRLNRLSDF